MIGDHDALAPEGRRALGHLRDRRAAVGLVGMHLMIGRGGGVPLGMRGDHHPRPRVRQEPGAERRRRGHVWRVADPRGDEVAGVRTDRHELGDAPSRRDEEGSLLRPPQRGA